MRYIGPKGPSPRAPFGLGGLSADGDAWLIALSEADSVATAAAILPAPASLSPGALLVILPEVPSARGLLSLFSAGRPASRSVRAGALLVRGYVDLGACVDPHTRLDLVWGRAP